MKILLVTPVNTKLKPGRPLPDWQPQNFWYKALTKLNHKVEVFSLPTGINFKPLTTLMLKLVIKQYQPDEILFSGGKDAVYPIADTIFFTGVSAAMLSETERQIGIKAKKVVTNDPAATKEWLKLKARKVVCLPISAVNREVFKARAKKRHYQASFVGTLFAERQVKLAEIAKLAPSLKIWGWLPSGVKLNQELRSAYQGEAWGKRVVDIYQQSLIGLNLTPDHLSVCGNLRTFEIAASGALLLTDKLNPDWFEPNKEAVAFASPAGVAKKISYYLDNQEKLKKIALAGKKRTLKEHTYVKRFEKLLNH